MTRINVGVEPWELPRAALLAEHREITRIPNAVREGRAKGSPVDRFKLGMGHVRFFYDKLGYLKRRYEALYRECRRRNYNVTDKRAAFDGLPEEIMGDYHAKPIDRRKVLDRLDARGHKLNLTRGDTNDG